MNEEIRQLIIQMRQALSERDDAPRVGDIRKGNDNAICSIDSWQEFLKECDGGRFGAIDLWSSDELDSYQDTVLQVEDPEAYLVVGQILYEPVAIERSTATLYWLPMNADPVTLDTADRFIRHFVLGSGYSEIVPDVDKEPWWELLQSQSVS